MLRKGLEPGRQDTHLLGPAQASAAVLSGEAPSWGLSVYTFYTQGDRAARLTSVLVCWPCRTGQRPSGC